MHLELSDEEATALTQELDDIVESDRYPLSPRIRTLRAILAKLRPEPVRPPLPPLKVYEPPPKGRYRGEGEIKARTRPDRRNLEDKDNSQQSDTSEREVSFPPFKLRTLIAFEKVRPF
jgi:hypothetical protein